MKKKHFINLLVPSADNFSKQFDPKSELPECQVWSGSKLFGTVIVFLKSFFEKVDFEKSEDDKTAGKISHGAKS